MPQRPKSLANQFLDPPDLENLFNSYSTTHSIEQTVAYLDGVLAVFGIVDEMLFAKMKDGTRWIETDERAIRQIDAFITGKKELLENLSVEYDKFRANPKPE